MSLEVSSVNAICFKCGTAYSRSKGYFAVHYGSSYKGCGRLSICKTCVDEMYSSYLSQCNDQKTAVRQMCRKLDIYWSEKLFNSVISRNTNRTVMTGYIAKVSGVAFTGKSYDDTLLEEGLLWDWKSKAASQSLNNDDSQVNDEENLSDEAVKYWGVGLKPGLYSRLEDKRTFWISGYPKDSELDTGTEALLRQICLLEVEIEDMRSLGQDVNKHINTLNSLIGSADLKPTKKKDKDSDSVASNTPLGVLAFDWEKSRPIPEIDPELKDVDGIVRYITIWFFGHLCKMIGIKNSYCKLYEEEIAKLRVNRPEFEDEDDDTMLNDIFGMNSSIGDTHD